MKQYTSTDLTGLESEGVDTSLMKLSPINDWLSFVVACGQADCPGDRTCPLCKRKFMTKATKTPNEPRATES